MGNPQTFRDLLLALERNLAQSTQLVGELMAAEVMLAVPDREKDSVDIRARKHECPACSARKGNPCSWAKAREQPSYLAHPSRRALVEPSS